MSSSTLAGDLVASEEQYRALFETMPQGIVNYDADGSVIGTNRAAGEILGMDLAAVMSWPVVADGQVVRADSSPFPPRDLPVRVALRTGEIVVGTVAGVRLRRSWVRAPPAPRSHIRITFKTSLLTRTGSLPGKRGELAVGPASQSCRVVPSDCRSASLP